MLELKKLIFLILIMSNSDQNNSSTLIEHSVYLNQFESFERIIIELSSSKKIINCPSLLTLRVFFQQMLVICNMLHDDYISLLKSSTFELYQLYNDKLSLRCPFNFFETTYTKIAKRYFFTELSSSIEQLLLDHINNDFSLKEALSTKDYKQCDIYNRMCFSNKTQKGLLNYVALVLKNNGLTKKQRKPWREFFDVIRAIRNRTGHSNQDISNSYDGKIIHESDFAGLELINGKVHVQFAFMTFAAKKAEEFCFNYLSN